MNYEDLIKQFVTADSSRLAELPPQSAVKIAGLVKKIREITTKKGERMAFVTLEDLRGVTELTVFADLYRSSLELLQSGEPVLVSGIREGEQDAPKVLANEIHRLGDAPRHFSKRIRIRLTTHGTDPAQIREIKKILNRHRGRTPVALHVVIPNRSETIISLGPIACEASEGFRADLHNASGNPTVSFE
jgi:DNA polymerase-3 subunit alpha